MMVATGRSLGLLFIVILAGCVTNPNNTPSPEPVSVVPPLVHTPSPDAPYYI